MPDAEDPPPPAPQDQEESELLSQAFQDDDLVEDDQDIIETNARFNANRILDQIAGLIDEAAALAIRIIYEPSGKLQILEEFV